MTKDFAHGLVIGKFYPPHPGHHFLVQTAADTCERVTVVAMAADVESIPLAGRVAWLREAFAGAPHTAVVGVVDNLPVDYDDADVWAGHVALMRDGVAAGEHHATPIDAVFTSEPYGAELARRFDAADVRLDVSRATFAVSGTKVRADPVEYWQLLAPPVRAWFTRRVVVLGAESSGTTTLSIDLADALRARGGAHAMTGWVGEYGRELTLAKLAVIRAKARLRATDDGMHERGMHERGMDESRKPEPTVFDIEWTDADFLAVAVRQTAAEDRAARAGGPVLVCDTDALATTIWQERYMGATTLEVAAAAAAMPPRALYILTSDVGVPFDDDGLRDGEHLRAWMTGRFHELLDASDVPTVEVGGDRATRLRSALEAVDEVAARGWDLGEPLG